MAAPGRQRLLDLVGADALAQVALERAEEVGEVLGERVVGLVGQRQQPDLAAQLAVVALELDEHPQRYADDVDAHLVGRRAAGGRRSARRSPRPRPGRRPARSAGREPDGLAVLLEVDAPRGRAARDDAEAAAEGEQQVVLVRRPSVGISGSSRRAVVDLDARVLAVPRTRTVSGGTACSSALVTSSETPSSAHSTRSSRPMSWQVSTTQRRASCTPRGPEPSDRAGLFSGTVGLHRKADQVVASRGSCTPAISRRNLGATVDLSGPDRLATTELVAGPAM